jgi:uncharacterized protein
VPVFILIALVLIIIQPRLAKRLATRRPAHARPGPVTTVLVFGTGIYGGYFGAAQGVILLAVLRLAFTDDLQRLNAVKNVLASLANGVAAVLFVVFAHIAWGAAAILAGSSIVGGAVGAHYGRRLPELWLRRIVIVGGTIVAVILIVD